MVKKRVIFFFDGAGIVLAVVIIRNVMQNHFVFALQL